MFWYDDLFRHYGSVYAEERTCSYSHVNQINIINQFYHNYITFFNICISINLSLPILHLNSGAARSKHVFELCWFSIGTGKNMKMIYTDRQLSSVVWFLRHIFSYIESEFRCASELIKAIYFIQTPAGCNLTMSAVEKNDTEALQLNGAKEANAEVPNESTASEKKPKKPKPNNKKNPPSKYCDAPNQISTKKRMPIVIVFLTVWFKQKRLSQKKSRKMRQLR